MSIQYLTQETLCARLPARPQTGSELQDLYEVTCDCDEIDVVVDFSEVVILTSACICDLMLINETQKLNSRQLILYNVNRQIMRVFHRTAIEPMFKFARSRDEALEYVKASTSSAL